MTISNAAKPLPPSPLLAGLLRYDNTTGFLYWRERSPKLFLNARWPAQRCANAWNAAWAGKRALAAMDNKGYLRGSLFYDMVFAHRVVWKMARGTDAEFIDHIDGNRSNNILENLRSIDKAENAKNKRLYASNKSGANGVYWRPYESMFIVSIKHNGQQIYLGSFADFKSAKECREKASTKYGYHENHGRAA